MMGMITDLYLWYDTGKIFAHLDHNAPLSSFTSHDLDRKRLLDMRNEAESALKGALLRKVGEDEWRELLSVGRRISALLPQSIKSSLIRHKENLPWSGRTQVRNERDPARTDATPKLLLRLRGEVIPVPWELFVARWSTLQDDQLLGEAYDIGRQIIIPPNKGGQTAFAPRAFPKDEINVLIVADGANPKSPAVIEGERITLKFRMLTSSNLKIKVVYNRGMPLRDFFRVLPYYDILHFAGEAESDKAQPEKTAWRFNSKEWLDPKAIRQAGVDPWPLLVFANGCRTAYFGDDSMARALLERGVQHYISTIALIPDAPIVVEIAESFYDALLEGKSVGQSLRQARRQLYDNCPDNLRHYSRLVAASYVHYGDPGGRFFEA